MKKLLFLLFLLLYIPISCKSKPDYNPLPVKENRIAVHVHTLEEKKPAFFSITLNKKRVNFFVMKVGSSIESYLDACMKCYHYGMGYGADHQYIRCRYCNTTYSLDSLKSGVGSCYPIPLRGELDGQEYIIQLNELKKAEKYFF